MIMMQALPVHRATIMPGIKKQRRIAIREWMALLQVSYARVRRVAKNGPQKSESQQADEL